MRCATVTVWVKIRRRCYVIGDISHNFFRICGNILFVLYIKWQWSIRNISVLIKEKLFLIYALNYRRKYYIKSNLLHWVHTETGTASSIITKLEIWGSRGCEMTMWFFWVVTPYELVGRLTHQRFEETHCLHFLFVGICFTYESKRRHKQDEQNWYKIRIIRSIFALIKVTYYKMKHFVI